MSSKLMGWWVSLNACPTLNLELPTETQRNNLVKLCEELNSEKYQQTRFVDQDESGYSVIGVINLLFGNIGACGIKETKSTYCFEYSPDFGSPSMVFTSGFLTWLNDNGVEFKRIAEIITLALNGVQFSQACENYKKADDVKKGKGKRKKAAEV